MTYATNPQRLAFISNNLADITAKLRFRDEQDGLPGVVPRPLQGKSINYKNLNGDWAFIHVTHLSTDSLIPWVTGVKFDVVDLFPYVNGDLYHVIKEHTSTTLDADIEAGCLEKVSGFDADLGEWTANTPIRAGYMVEFNGQLLKATVDHSSSDLFESDADKWVFLANTKITTDLIGPNYYSYKGHAVDDGGKVWFCITPHTSAVWDTTSWGGVTNVALAAPVADFVGATATTAGQSGLVKRPQAGDQNKALFGSGDWGAIPEYTISTGRRIAAGTVLQRSDLNSLLLVDTSVAGFNLTLISNPQVGDTFFLADSAQKFDTHPVVLSTNRYFGQNQSYTLSTKGVQVQVTYRGAQTGWTVVPTFGTLSVDLNAYSAPTGRTISIAEALVISDLSKVTLIDTRAGSFNLDLPTSPNVDDIYYIQDAYSQFGVHALAINNNIFYGQHRGLVLNQTGLTAALVYRGGDVGWVLMPLVQDPGNVHVAPLNLTGRTFTQSDVVLISDMHTAMGANTSAGAFTLTLPSSPAVDDEYAFFDPVSSWGTKPLTVEGGTVFGQNNPWVLNTAGGFAIFTYRGLTTGWTVRGSDPINYATITRGMISTGRLVKTNTALSPFTDLNKVTMIDTLGGPVTIELPANPSIDDIYFLIDAGFDWGVNHTILTNNTYFGHANTTQTLDMSGATVVLVYRGAEVGWTIGSVDALADTGPLMSILSLKANQAALDTEITERQTAVSALSTQVAALQSSLATAGDVHLSDLTAEAQTRAAADAGLQTSINNINIVLSQLSTDLGSEVTTRSTAISAVQSSITALQSSLTNATTTLNASISSEVSAREAAVSQLNTTLTAQLSALAQDLSALGTALTTETSDRTTAINNLYTGLASETTARTNAIGLVNLSISGEVNARQTGDNALQQQINDEVTARTNSVSGFASDLSSETTARQAADTAQTQALAAETTARQLAITTVSTALDAEVAARAAAVTAVADSLTTEVATRTTATAHLQTEIDSINAILANVATGGGIDGAIITDLTNRVVALEALTSTLQTNLTAETTARTGAIATLTNALSSEATTRASADTALNNALGAAILQQSQDQAANATALTAINTELASLRTDLTAETSARTGADTAQNTALTAEVSAREAADTATNTALAAEVTTRSEQTASLNLALAAETTARTNDVIAVNVAIAAETTARTTSINNLSTALDTEATTRADAITAVTQSAAAEATTRAQQTSKLTTDLAAEVTARQGDTTALSQALATEISDRQSAITALSSSTSASLSGLGTDVAGLRTDLTAETTARANADSVNAAAIADEITARSTVTSGLRTDLTAETTARTSADTALGARIDTEHNAWLAATGDLTTALSNETTARTAADTTNANAITAEAAARAAAITALNTSLSADIAALALFPSEMTAALDTETAARIAGDSANATSISNEATARASADTALGTRIDTEVSNRAGADAALQTAIDTEVTTRLGLTNGLRADLTAETTARTSADTTLTTTLNNEITTRTALTDALATADSAEATARANADTALGTRIDNEITARTSADTTLQTNIDNEATARANAITAEANTRAAADTANSNAIAALTQYTKTYAVAVGASVTIEVSTGVTALTTNMAYRIRLSITSTSNVTGSVYIVTYSGGVWAAKLVTTNTIAGGNYPQLKITGSNIQIFHNHATTSYNIKTTIEAYDSGNATATNATIFGLDGALSYDANGSLLTVPNVSATSITYSGLLTGGTGVVNLGSGQFYKDASGNIGFGTTTTTGGLITTKVALNSTNTWLIQADNSTINTKLAAITLNRFNFDSAGTAAEIAFYRATQGQEGEIVFSTNPGGTNGLAATARIRITGAGTLRPETNNGVDSGTSTFRWNNQYVTNLDYAGTLTGGTGVVNIGSGQFYKDASGNVTIGSTNLYTTLAVESAGTLVTGNAQRFHLALVDTTVVAAGVGGGITFYGNYTGTTKIGFAGIQGIKENATAGDTAGALILTTRVNAANMAEVARYTSAGHHLPKTTAAQDSGSSTLRWNNQYSVNVDYSGTFTGGTGTMTIGTTHLTKDTSGRFVFGAASPVTTDFTGAFISAVQIQGTSDATTSLGVVRYSADANGSHLILGKSRGAAVGASGLVSAGDEVGGVHFVAHDGSTGLRRTGYVRSVVEQTPAAGNIPAGIAIGVAYNGDGTFNEAWRFNSYGHLNSQGSAPRPVNVANGANAGGTMLMNLETVRANTWSGMTIVTHNSTTVGYGPTIAFARTRGTAVGDSTVVQNGDGLGGVTWVGADGTNLRSTAAEIVAVVDGSPATGSVPGRIYVATTAVGGTSPTKRAYWDASGNYLPFATGTYDQGSATLRWKGLYSNTLDTSGTVAVGTNLTVGGTITVTGAVSLTAGLPLIQVKDENGTVLSDDSVKNNLLAAPHWGSPVDGWAYYSVQGTNSTAWVTMPNGEQGLVWQGDSIVGLTSWFAGPINAPVAIKNDRAYRVMIPVRRTSANTDSQLLYIGGTNVAGTLDTLNTSVTNANPYFATLNLINMVQNKWYLMVAYIYPTGVTGLTTNGALYDMDTGARVSWSGVTDFNWNTAATAFRLRSGLYKATATTQIATVQWGKPRMEVMDGAESDYSFMFANQGGAGNNLGLVGTNVTIRGTRILKTGGVTSTWDAGAYSKVGYTNGCYLRMQVTSTSTGWIAGLNTDPSTDAGYLGIDYCFYCNGNTTLNIRESGSAIDSVGTIAVGDILTILYDGDTIIYQINGTIIRSVAANVNGPLYFDCSLYTLNASAIENIEFGPLNSVNNSSALLTDLFDLPIPENAIQHLGGQYETVKVTALADTAGSLAGKYFRLFGMGGTAAQVNPAVSEQIIDVWFQVSGSGTQPVSGAGRYVQVNITTGATAIAVAAAIASAFSTDAAYKSVGVDGAGSVTFVSASPADNTTATAGTSGFTVTIVTNGSGILSGTNLYAGGVLAPNGKVYSIPYNATSILVTDPDTGATFTFGSPGAGSSKYITGRLARDGKIYCAPATAANVLVIDPNNNTLSTIGSGLGSYRGCALAPNGKIYAVSITTGNILVINPATQTVTTLGSGIGAYYDAVLGMDGFIYGIPEGAATILRIDPNTDTYTTFGVVSGTGSKYLTGTLAPNGKIYCPPAQATGVLVIDPATLTVSTFGTFDTTLKYGSSTLGANGKVYCMPRLATSILVIDPETNTTATVGNLANSDKYIGCILTQNGKVIGTPLNALMPIAVSTGTSTFPKWYLSAHFNGY
jgi:hypothetical protein